jgi:hypothetical protein
MSAGADPEVLQGMVEYLYSGKYDEDVLHKKEIGGGDEKMTMPTSGVSATHQKDPGWGSIPTTLIPGKLVNPNTDKILLFNTKMYIAADFFNIPASKELARKSTGAESILSVLPCGGCCLRNDFQECWKEG